MGGSSTLAIRKEPSPQLCRGGHDVIHLSSMPSLQQLRFTYHRAGSIETNRVSFVTEATSFTG
jgi:hypothetical protein